MKTKVHYYNINVAARGGKQAYAALVKQIKADAPDARGRWMKAIGMKAIGENVRKYRDSEVEEVKIETEYLFDNQWNTTTKRIFDWYEEVIFSPSGAENRTIKRGHWTEITPEMAELRRSTFTCGYCGAHYGPRHELAPKGGFCLTCLDLPYLKEEELYLLRLVSLVGDRTREPLTEDERAILVPAYVEMQTVARCSRAKARRAKQREKVLNDYERDVSGAAEERDGLLWLWDQGFDLENVIYYDHTRRFHFGWRSPVSELVASKILEVISEFPYSYTITCADGRKLEN